jgi:hypothetical protein
MILQNQMQPTRMPAILYKSIEQAFDQFYQKASPRNSYSKTNNILHCEAFTPLANKIVWVEELKKKAVYIKAH